MCVCVVVVVVCVGEWEEEGVNRLGSSTQLSLLFHCSLLSLAPGRTPVAYLAGRGGVQSNWQAW